MKRITITGALASTLLTGVALVAGGTPASAAGCGTYPYKTSTSTSVTHNGYCIKVQARIDRYYAGSVYRYYGPQDSARSYVSASNGSNAGNYYRYVPTAYSSWTSWYRI